jgi:hypothetical protein
MATKAKERLQRVEQRVACANAFISAIASRGRKFFAFKHEGEATERVAFIERDARGKLWLHNEWSRKRIYIGDRRGEWRGFHHGGMLRQLIEGLTQFIREGGPLWGAEGFGRHWAYENMAEIVAEGQRLGIIRKPEINYADAMQLPEGKTCESCRHCNRCVSFGYSWQARTSCDFYPNRYQATDA